MAEMAEETAGELPCKTRTVVVEVKYFSTQNVVIHTENCKLDLPLDCSTTQMEKNIRRMCGIEESSRRRGFADFAIEVFYIDFIEAGSSRKASFVLRTKDQLEMLKPVNLNSLKGEERVPSESDESPNSNEGVSLPPKSPNNEQVDSQ